jgi:CRP-like cAMP-binding protein
VKLGGEVADRGAGDLVGGAAALCRALSSYGARALGDSLVLRIAEQDFYDQAEEHARLTRGTLAYLVGELEPLLQLDDGPPHVAARFNQDV